MSRSPQEQASPAAGTNNIAEVNSRAGQSAEARRKPTRSVTPRSLRRDDAARFADVCSLQKRHEFKLLHDKSIKRLFVITLGVQATPDQHATLALQYVDCLRSLRRFSFEFLLKCATLKKLVGTIGPDGGPRPGMATDSMLTSSIVENYAQLRLFQNTPDSSDDQITLVDKCDYLEHFVPFAAFQLMQRVAVAKISRWLTC